jgi:F-type H+-transporting ATPase subunit a
MDAETTHQAVEHGAVVVGQAAKHAAAAAHAAAGHETAAHTAADVHGGISEVPNVITLLSNRWHDHPAVAWLHQWENLVFSLLVGALLVFITWRYARRPSIVPGGWQNVLELLVEALDGLVRRVIGPGGRKHTPLIGTLFLYIWIMNLSGLVPGFKSSTSSLNTTIGLATVVFFYVHWVGIREQGLLKYLDHLAGSPRDVAGWLLVPLMLPLHVMGEIIRPVSLSLRLGLNVFAEDVLLGQLVLLGLGAGVALHLPIGVPIQLFAIPLILIFSTVQALVFSLLTAVYISLMSPHDTAEHH